MKSAEEFIKEHGKPQFGKLENKKSENQKLENQKLNNKQQETTEMANELLEFDQLKTKVLKYVLYKKRTEQEVKNKFSSSQNANMLEEVIDNLKENGYINDVNYIERAVNEFLAISTLSLKEMKNKLYAKGLSTNLIDNYFTEHIDVLEEYELSCAKKIILKKQMQLEKEEIERFLYKKGYPSSCVRKVYEEMEGK